MSLDALMPSTQSFLGWTTHIQAHPSHSKNVIWFNRLTTKFHHDLHNLFLMEITLNNAHRAALARGHSIDRHYIKITV